MESTAASTKINFTLTTIRALPVPEEGRKVYHDTKVPGLGLRITSAGTITFFVRARMEGKQDAPRITLGRFPALTPELAREKASKVLRDMATGIDPTLAKRADKLRTHNLLDIWEDYKKARTLKPTTLHDYERHLNEGLKDYSKKPYSRINEEVVKELYNDLKKKSVARANGAMRVLRALGNFARIEYKDERGQPIYPNNPVNILSESDRWAPVKRRQTILRDYQIKPWWEAVNNIRNKTYQANSVADYFQTLLLTGIRPGHLSLIAKHRPSKSHTGIQPIGFYNERAAVITMIPKSSNDSEIDIPLSDVCNAIVKHACRISNDPLWIWHKLDGGPMDESVPRHWQGVIEAETGIVFARNDLRRSFITMAEALDISRYTVKRLAGHTISDAADVTAGYIISANDRLRRATQTITDTFMELVNKQ